MARNHSHGVTRHALAAGVALVCSYMCLDLSVNFVTQSTVITKASRSYFANAIEVQRSKEQRTVMYNSRNDKFANDLNLVEFKNDSVSVTAPTRRELLDKLNLLSHNGRHNKLKKWSAGNQHPVLSYAVAEVNQNTGEIIEPAGSVLRRLRNLFAEDFAMKKYWRKKYFRNLPKGKYWEESFDNDVLRRATKRRRKQAFDDAWDNWVRKSGRRLNIQEQMVYNGPKLASLLTPELDEKSEPKAVLKLLPGKQDPRGPDVRMSFSKLGPLFDMMPGNWNTDGIDNIHKVWMRPLCKHAYDIPRFRQRGWKVTRGIVV